jgi:hypothetical protein
LGGYRQNSMAKVLVLWASLGTLRERLWLP